MKKLLFALVIAGVGFVVAGKEQPVHAAVAGELRQCVILGGVVNTLYELAKACDPKTEPDGYCERLRDKADEIWVFWKRHC